MFAFHPKWSALARDFEANIGTVEGGGGGGECINAQKNYLQAYGGERMNNILLYIHAQNNYFQALKWIRRM